MREIQEIYDELLEVFAQRAGFLPRSSCDSAARLWAAAAQLQALELQADWVLNQSFPQTAQGVYLDYHGQMRGLARQEAAKAEGTIRFYVETAALSDITIPAETVCITEAETRFQTTEAVVLPLGELWVDAPAQAMEGGSAGNVLPEAVRYLAGCPWGISGCINPEAFSGGTDQEDDESFRARILESYQRLPNGANAAWYEQTAMSHSGVAAARAIGRARGIGTVDVYIATETGLPSEELLNSLQAELQAKREIAVDVQVLAPEIQYVSVTATVAPADGYSFEEVKVQAEQVISGYFTGRRLGEPFLVAELTSRLYALEGVKNCKISEPFTDLDGADGMLRLLGKATVTEMGG